LFQQDDLGALRRELPRIVTVRPFEVVGPQLDVALARQNHTVALSRHQEPVAAAPTAPTSRGP